MRDEDLSWDLSSSRPGVQARAPGTRVFFGEGRCVQD